MRFTESCVGALTLAATDERRGDCVDARALLAALIRWEWSEWSRLLLLWEVDPEPASTHETTRQEAVVRLELPGSAWLPVSAEVQELLAVAASLAEGYGHSVLDTGHLAVALVWKGKLPPGALPPDRSRLDAAQDVAEALLGGRLEGLGVAGPIEDTPAVSPPKLPEDDSRLLLVGRFLYLAEVYRLALCLLFATSVAALCWRDGFAAATAAFVAVTLAGYRKRTAALVASAAAWRFGAPAVVAFSASVVAYVVVPRLLQSIWIPRYHCLRVPRVSLALAVRHPLAARALRRGDRLLREMRPLDARDAYGAIAGTSGRLQLAVGRRSVLCAALAGDPQEALSKSRDMPRDYLMIRCRMDAFLMLSRIDDAESELSALRSMHLSFWQRVDVDRLSARLLTARGAFKDARAHAERGVSAAATRWAGLEFLTGLRVLADVLHASGQPVAAAQAAQDAMTVVYAMALRFRTVGDEELSHLGRRRVTLLEMERTALQLAELLAETGYETDDIDGYLEEETGAIAIALRLGAHLDAGRASLALARHLRGRGSGERSRAFHLAMRAVALLGNYRYQLLTEAERVAWVRAHAEAFELAIGLAVEQGDALAAVELIEAARLQAIPSDQTSPSRRPRVERKAEPAEVASRLFRTDDQWEAAAAAAVGELALLPPPAIRVDGKSRICAAGPVVSPAVVDLERAISVAAAERAWYYGTWPGAACLYWALLDPEGHAYCGAISLTPGSPAADALAKLNRALPVASPGEFPIEVAARVADGPLFGTDYAAEYELACELASALIPAPLQEGLLDQSDRPTLLVAPAAILARVPWMLLALGHHAHLPPEEQEDRILDLAHVRLVPPAAVLALIGARSPAAGPALVELAVIDPDGTLSAARSLSQAVRASNCLVGAAATADEVSSRLRQLDTRSASAIFACHCTTAVADASSASALLLAGGSRITAADLLRDRGPSPRFPFPSRVLLSACDSAGAASAETGEWLSFGPAALIAGADVAAVTLFPVPADAAFDISVADALNDGATLADAVAQNQRSALSAWRQDVRHRPPGFWAAYCLIGRDETSESYEAARLVGVRRASGDLVHALDLLCRDVADGRRRVVTTGHFVVGWLEDATDDMPMLAAVPRLLLTVGMTLLFGWERADRTQGTPAAVSRALCAAITRAGDFADVAGRDAVAVVDVIQALRGTRTLGGWLLRLTGVDSHERWQLAAELAADEGLARDHYVPQYQPDAVRAALGELLIGPTTQGGQSER